MAAAGLGNLLSDVAGVGLSNKIEEFAERLGFQMPELTRAGGLLKQSDRISHIDTHIPYPISIFMLISN
jgi:hypothetical protein